MRALPTDQLGVDVEDNFRPTFTIVPGKGNFVRRLMKAIRECEAVYAATPPGRAGEALAWHLLALSPDAKDKSIYRVTLHALTVDAIRAAFAAPRPLDMQQIEADLTERILDRLVGWSVNSAARKALGFKTALSYGGMMALRLLAAREQEVAAFTPQTTWRVSVVFERDRIRFTAQVLNAKGAPLTLRNEEQAAQLEMLLKHGIYWVDKTGQTLKADPAPAALTLSELIKTAERELSLSPDRTLALLDTLYDAGWVTHLNGKPPQSLSDAAKAFIRREFGTDYIAPDALVTTDSAPADVNREPEYLPGDGAALYGLIWLRFVAAHMPSAQERLMTARLRVGASMNQPYPLDLRATAARLYFDGWQHVIPTGAKDNLLPVLREGDPLAPKTITIEAATITSPARYTAASLVRALVEHGFAVQRAAQTVETLSAGEYVIDTDGRLSLSENGQALVSYLVKSFDELTSPSFAAELTADLERIASGERERLDVLHDFWARFSDTLCPISVQRVVGEHKPIVLRPVEEG